MTVVDGDRVERELRVDAAPGVVFPYFTDAEQMVRWMGLEAKLEPVPGGAFRIEMAGGHVTTGEYVVVEPPHRVVFTWGWEGEGADVPPGSSRVEVTLVPDGAGTIVRLVHTDLAAGAGEIHGIGWDLYLPRLVVAAAGGDPGPVPLPE